MRRQPWRLMDGVFPYAASRFRVIASTCWYFAPDRDQQAACEGARTGLASLDKGLTAQRQLPTHTFSPSVEAWPDRGARSEEHTSELQSRENIVCRLLLEEK